MATECSGSCRSSGSIRVAECQISVMITRFVTVFCVFRSPCADFDALGFEAAAVASDSAVCHDVTSFPPFTASVAAATVVGILLLLFFFECLSFAAVFSAELRLCNASKGRHKFYIYDIVLPGVNTITTFSFLCLI